MDSRVARITLVAAAAIALGCVALAVLLVFERGRTFRYDKTTGAGRVLGIFRIVGVSEMGVCRCAPDEIARISLPGGFSTRLSLYDRGGPASRPGLVVAHGNTWLGSGLSTYRLLASELARRGYIVATIDFPGFGHADDPFGRGPSRVADAYDRPRTLTAAVDWLIANTSVDASNITLLGHSAGVDWAMRAASSDPHVSRVAVMVAPPPPVIEGSLKRDTPEYDAARGAYYGARYARQYEFVYGKHLPDWYRWELLQPHGRYDDDVFDFYARPGHKPLLVIVGERDQPSGHASVRARFETLTQPKELLLIEGSDHYLTSAQSLGLVFYDARVARRIAGGLSAWIEQSTP